MSGQQEKSEFEERAELIESMLDKIYPLPPESSAEDREAIESDRQMLVIRSEWSTMPLNELRKTASR